MRRLPHRSLRLLCILLPLAGCNEAGRVRTEPALRDSAGISIVEHRALDAARTDSVSGPVLTIGQVAGAEEYELYDVNGVVRLSDGSVAVATAGIEIRWFDAQGRFRRRAGRDGDGPGEFRRIRYIRDLVGDSLLVFDSGNRRVSILAPDGSFVRGQSVGLDEDRPVTVAGALRDGTLLTRTVLETARASTPLYRSRMAFTVARGEAVFALPPYPGPEAALHAAESGGDIATVFVSVLPFARAAHAAAGPDEFFVGSSDSYQIDVWNAQGRLVRIIRAAVPVKPVTEDVHQEFVSREIERMRKADEEHTQSFNEADARRRMLDQAHAPAIPAFADLLATAEGGLWVKEFILPNVEPAPERRTIFDPEGRLAATIILPPGFTALHVHGDLVIGVFRDTLDVPYVHGYRFR